MAQYFVALGICFLLAGCSGGGGGGDGSASTATTTSPGSGQVVVAPAAKAPLIHVGICDVSSGPSGGMAGTGSASLEPAVCPFSQAFAGNLSGLTAALVEAVWVPGATVTGAGLIIQSDQCNQSTSIDASGVHQGMCDHGTAAGSSPLSLLLTAEVLEVAGGDDLAASLIPDGVSTSQAFTVYVSLFAGLVPSGYTAIPA